METNEKSGWKQYTGEEKEVDQTSFLPLTCSFFLADTLPKHDGRLVRPAKIPLTRGQPQHGRAFFLLTGSRSGLAGELLKLCF